jgi:hypothetical protein
MHDYTDMRRRLGRAVNQTLDSPIMLFEFWELSEIFVALFMILVLGILFYEWALLCIFLIITLVGLPYVRRNFNKGMAFHFPYSRLGMRLPGLVNPRGSRRMSD